MNGDQLPQTPVVGRQPKPDKPVDNPPSLSEPSRRRPETPAPIEDEGRSTATTPLASEKVVLENSATTPVVDEPSDSAADFYPPEDSQLDDGVGLVSPPAEDSPEGVVEWVSSGEELRSATAAWRIRMTLISLVASGVIYLISRDLISAGSVAVVGLLFAFLGSRKPPSLQYRLDHTGITIGQKRYMYGEFRAFSVIDDARSPTIAIVPLKRFLPLLSVHYDPQQRDKIVEILADHLPLEMRRRDAFDSIINRIKF